ncbi:N-acetyltransferase family protein [Ornithinimicrobium panacihumi]|uniref:GNAT family N-acetyltransferase n=1 Tax=Ornithinimicrobium panacihumi TaxID=2008449 RepID=UPI003F8BD65E
MQLTLIRPAGTPAPPGAEPGIAPADDEAHAVPMVRPILERDLEAVGRLYHRASPDGEVGDLQEAVDDIRASWAGDYGSWLPGASLLAEVRDEPVAAVLTVDSPPWDDVADLVFIIDLFTHPDHRGRGLASLLVELAVAAVDPARDIGLRVESDNAPAVAIYRRLGFVPRD